MQHATRECKHSLHQQPSLTGDSPVIATNSGTGFALFQPTQRAIRRDQMRGDLNQKRLNRLNRTLHLFSIDVVHTRLCGGTGREY